MSSATRMQAYRERLAHDVIMVTVSLSFSTIGSMVACGVLTAAESEDRKALGDAVAEVLADTFKRR